MCPLFALGLECLVLPIMARGLAANLRPASPSINQKESKVSTRKMSLKGARAGPDQVSKHHRRARREEEDQQAGVDFISFTSFTTNATLAVADLSPLHHLNCISTTAFIITHASSYSSFPPSPALCHPFTSKHRAENKCYTTKPSPCNFLLLLLASVSSFAPLTLCPCCTVTRQLYLYHAAWPLHTRSSLSVLTPPSTQRRWPA